MDPLIRTTDGTIGSFCRGVELNHTEYRIRLLRVQTSQIEPVTSTLETFIYSVTIGCQEISTDLIFNIDFFYYIIFNYLIFIPPLSAANGKSGGI